MSQAKAVNQLEMLNIEPRRASAACAMTSGSKKAHAAGD